MAFAACGEGTPGTGADRNGYLAALASDPAGTSWFTGREDVVVGFGENACFTAEEADGDGAEVQALVITYGAEDGLWDIPRGVLLTEAAFTHLCPEHRGLIGDIQSWLDGIGGYERG